MSNIIKKIKHLYNTLNNDNTQKVLYYLTDLSNNPQYRKLLDTVLIAQGLTYAPSEVMLLNNKLQTQKAAHDHDAIQSVRKTIRYIKKSHKCYVYFNNYYKHVEADDVAQAIQSLIKQLKNNDAS